MLCYIKLNTHTLPCSSCLFSGCASPISFFPSKVLLEHSLLSIFPSLHFLPHFLCLSPNYYSLFISPLLPSRLFLYVCVRFAYYSLNAPPVLSFFPLASPGPRLVPGSPSCLCALCLSVCGFPSCLFVFVFMHVYLCMCV